jgi:predicted O-methyltransferase YrrM
MHSASGLWFGGLVLAVCLSGSANPVAGQEGRPKSGPDDTVQLKPGEYAFTKNWTDRKKDDWLKHLGHLKGKADLTMLEVGTYEGRSAIWFLENILTHPASKITCVDIFVQEGVEERFDHNIAVSGHAERVIKLKGYSQLVLRSLEPNAFDVVYIDACHQASCVFMDIAYGWDLLKEDGILIFDDYLLRAHLPGTNRPKEPIDAFLSAFEDAVEILHKEWQVILRKTKSSPWHIEGS